MRNVIKNLSVMEPIISNTGILYAGTVEDEEYDAVCLLDITGKGVYSVEANSWAKTIGYIVDEGSYGNEKFATLVLWEMTWFGYDEKTIQEKIQSWEGGNE